MVRGIGKYLLCVLAALAAAAPVSAQPSSAGSANSGSGGCSGSQVAEVCTSAGEETSGHAPSPFLEVILEAQNAARARYNEPPLRWNSELADHAAWWAEQMARMQQLVHAPREGRGIERENLQEGMAGWGPLRFVSDWLAVERSFHRGVFPNVCDGPWTLCAHWTQIIWHGTTDVGCAVAHSVVGRAAEIATRAWLVCRYSPGGNKDGKPVGMTAPTEYAEQPKLPPAEVLDRSSAQVAPDRTSWPAPIIDRPYVREKGKIAAYGDVELSSIPAQKDPKPSSGALTLLADSLLEFGDGDGISGLIGGGVGVARIDYNNVRRFSNQGLPDDGEKDFARHLLAGLRCADGSEAPYVETAVQPPELPSPDPLEPLVQPDPIYGCIM